MIIALEFDEFIPSSISSGQSYRRHGRFCTTVHHPDLLYGGYQFSYQFRYLNLHGSRCTKGSTSFHGFNYRFSNDGMIMTQDHWAPAVDQFYISIVVFVIYISTVSPFDKNGITSHRFKCAHRGVDTSWYKILCLFKKAFALVNLHVRLFYSISSAPSSSLKIGTKLFELLLLKSKPKVSFPF